MFCENLKFETEITRKNVVIEANEAESIEIYRMTLIFWKVSFMKCSWRKLGWFFKFIGYFKWVSFFHEGDSGIRRIFATLYVSLCVREESHVNVAIESPLGTCLKWGHSHALYTSSILASFRPLNPLVEVVCNSKLNTPFNVKWLYYSNMSQTTLIINHIVFDSLLKSYIRCESIGK